MDFKTLTLRKLNYRINNNLLIMIFDEISKEYDTITVNLLPLKGNRAFIDTKSFPWIEEWLVANHYAKKAKDNDDFLPPKWKGNRDFYPLYEFDTSLIPDFTDESLPNGRFRVKMKMEVELTVAAETKEDVRDWLDNTTPIDAVKQAEKFGRNVEITYSERILRDEVIGTDYDVSAGEYEMPV